MISRTLDLAEGRNRTGTRGLGLIARASRGDVAAFERLVQEHSGLVHRIALRTLGSEEDAQDAGQEVWIRVWANIKSFRGESAFSTWLYRIATNTCLSLRRGKARREAREFADETPRFPEPTGEEVGPEAAALDSERREEIQVALAHVRAEHRDALVLRHLEGLSYAEIAKILGVPSGTAKGWASRGRAALHVALTQAGSAGGKTKRYTLPTPEAGGRGPRAVLEPVGPRTISGFEG